MLSKLLKNICRLFFAGLITFELLNFFEILDFTLDFSWFGLVVTATFVWISFEIVSHIFQRRQYDTLYLHIALLFATISTYLDALGDILRFYSTYQWYDNIVHFLGGLICAFGVWVILNSLNKNKKIQLGKLGISFFSISAATFLTVLYEIEEYLEDVFTGSHRLGDGPDTANDLLLGIIGAIIIVSILEFVYHQRSASKET